MQHVKTTQLINVQKQFKIIKVSSLENNSLQRVKTIRKYTREKLINFIPLHFQFCLKNVLKSQANVAFL